MRVAYVFLILASSVFTTGCGGGAEDERALAKLEDIVANAEGQVKGTQFEGKVVFVCDGKPSDSLKFKYVGEIRVRPSDQMEGQNAGEEEFINATYGYADNQWVFQHFVVSVGENAEEKNLSYRELIEGLAPGDPKPLLESGAPPPQDEPARSPEERAPELSKLLKALALIED